MSKSIDELVNEASQRHAASTQSANGLAEFHQHAHEDVAVLSLKILLASIETDEARTELATLYKELADKDKEIAFLRGECAKKSAEMGELCADNFRLRVVLAAMNRSAA